MQIVQEHSGSTARRSHREYRVSVVILNQRVGPSLHEHAQQIYPPGQRRIQQGRASVPVSDVQERASANKQGQHIHSLGHGRQDQRRAPSLVPRVHQRPGRQQLGDRCSRRGHAVQHQWSTTVNTSVIDSAGLHQQSHHLWRRARRSDVPHQVPHRGSGDLALLHRSDTLGPQSPLLPELRLHHAQPRLHRGQQAAQIRRGRARESSLAGVHHCCGICAALEQAAGVLRWGPEGRDQRGDAGGCIGDDGHLSQQADHPLLAMARSRRQGRLPPARAVRRVGPKLHQYRGHIDQALVYSHTQGGPAVSRWLVHFVASIAEQPNHLWVAAQYR
mmetsp:Transcript_21372/g.54616  ORF Transcript_21372/g.54616 Transcript_21372/m.54616 type:complete len:331 (-) Transcript_21372:591-1583(-)